MLKWASQSSDVRDKLTWVPVALSSTGEIYLEEGTISDRIRMDLKVSSDFPIFIPVKTYGKGEKRIVVTLIQGYIFLQSGLDTSKYLSLEGKSYVDRVQTKEDPQGYRLLATVSDDVIKDLKDNLSKMLIKQLPLGVTVKVIDGTFTGFTGTLVAIDNDMVSIGMSLQTRELIITVPIIAVEEVHKND